MDEYGAFKIGRSISPHQSCRGLFKRGRGSFPSPRFCPFHARANGSCSAACQLFHEQTIRDTIDQGGYALVPFQVINDKQNEKHGFPRTGVQWTDLPHAHWCVIAGYATTDNSKLLAKHWGENRLFDIDELGNSNQGCYPLQQTNNITAQRASKVQLLQNQIITILPAQASPGRRRGCAC